MRLFGDAGGRSRSDLCERTKIQKVTEQMERNVNIYTRDLL